MRTLTEERVEGVEGEDKGMTRGTDRPGSGSKKVRS